MNSIQGIPVNPPLPHDNMAEQAILGCVLKKHSSLAVAMTYVKPKDFYNKSNQRIYEALIYLSNVGTNQYDSITVGEALDALYSNANRAKKHLKNIAKSEPKKPHIKSYCKIVQQKSLARKLIKTCQNIIHSSYRKNDDSVKLLDNATSQVLNLDTLNSDVGLQPLNNVAKKSISHLEKVQKNKNGVTGEPTGYKYIDQLTTGLHAGEFIVIAARPAMGKTTIALNIARNVANKTHKTVAIFSLEMGAVSIANRIFCAGGDVDAQHVRKGMLTQNEETRLTMAISQLTRDHIYIDDTPGINVASILARSRRLAKQTHNLGLIVIDYLQLVEGIKSPNRQLVVSMISRQLKKLAKELNVPVIALSQLSRSVEQRDDKRPVLSDIRESGSIEQDADIVAFLYRKDYYQRKKQRQQNNSKQITTTNQKKLGDPSITDFIIEKNRSGPQGTVKLMFYKAYNKFANIDPRFLKKTKSLQS